MSSMRKSDHYIVIIVCGYFNVFLTSFFEAAFPVELVVFYISLV